jgi:hypothetical protein
MVAIKDIYLECFWRMIHPDSLYKKSILQYSVNCDIIIYNEFND